MTKKMLVVGLALIASVCLTTNVFASDNCTTANIVFNGVGSSAQANSFAIAAYELAGGSSAGAHLVSSSAGVNVYDKRPTGGVHDGANPFWVVWDNNPTCNVYAYFTIDSGAGVKDFFAYEKFTNSSGKVYTSLAATYVTVTPASMTTLDVLGGIADPAADDLEVSTSGSVFQNVIAPALNLTPENRVATGNVQAPKYCGNLTTTSTAALTQYQCFFNVGATDIRPEDALYATTRALTSYTGWNLPTSAATPTKVGNGELTGLGYNTAANATCTGTAQLGCTIVDSFNQGKKFNVVTFKLSGTDPIGGGTLPASTTLTTGAEPVLVIVHNGTDFGQTSSQPALGGTTYTYNDINKQILAGVFDGTTHCVGDLLSTSAAGPGNPIQVVEREPLSGTYNTFEFTAVRTLAGSSNAFTVPNNSTTFWPPSNAYNSQEQFNNPASYPGGNGTSCAAGYPQSNCFNPLYNSPSVTTCSTGTGYQEVRLRAIGTGEEVKATVGSYNTGAGNAAVDNSIGYAFWGYGNLAPLCSGVSSSATTSCTGGGGSYIGHYLTVDGIDPLFTTEGGALDVTPNSAGAFNPPYCNVTGESTPGCLPIPFTHVLDGTYPLWSMLRVVTLENVSGKVATPPYVLDMVAEAETQTQSDGLSDFVPFLKNLNNSGTLTAPAWTGDLGLFVFRSHYTQATIKPYNGHTTCAGVYTGVSLQGGNKTSNTCLVDLGGDVGGSVLTVQADADAISDWGHEEYVLHQ
jgi:hypothetical protein